MDAISFFFKKRRKIGVEWNIYSARNSNAEWEIPSACISDGKNQYINERLNKIESQTAADVF